ncbi:MAG: outer membrane lipoprotein carrier protein LolA [Zetaproteobacteria bacterium]|nr:MAG: outer membrane lipoprotein carrier protein LolA [Zetaproteobacteria bacterium]
MMRPLWCALLLCSYTLSAFAADDQATLRQRIAAFSNSVGFSCTFEQEVYLSDGQVQRYAGSLEVLRPGRFRWEYREPYAQLYLGDGRLIWHYEPDLMQVERMSNLDAVDPLVMRLLDGRLESGRLTLLDVRHERGRDAYRIRVGAMAPVWLAFDRADGRLAYVESTDALGNRNRIRFTRCSLVAPPSQRFSFAVPKGVDVIDVQPRR